MISRSRKKEKIIGKELLMDSGGKRGARSEGGGVRAMHGIVMAEETAQVERPRVERFPKDRIAPPKTTTIESRILECPVPISDLMFCESLERTAPVGDSEDGKIGHLPGDDLRVEDADGAGGNVKEAV